MMVLSLKTTSKTTRDGPLFNTRTTFRLGLIKELQTDHGEAVVRPLSGFFVRAATFS